MAKRSSRKSSGYQCTECGWVHVQWVGRCAQCQEWGSVAEQATSPSGRPAPGGGTGVTAAAQPIEQVPAEEAQARSSGVSELDRVLGDGLVPGAAILLAGEPGVGKSTLLLEVAAKSASSGERTLYLTGEESAGQVRLRADRTAALHSELYLAAETDLGAILTQIEQVRPTLVVIDSVQSINVPDTTGVPGGVTQVKEAATALVRMTKLHNITLLLVGHVTKEGSIAGPRALEHLVDVVLQFEGERGSDLRLLRAVKNRYGPVDEVGCFALSASGIEAIADPSGLFLDTHHGSVPGTCVAVMMEGRRPMLCEVQALVTQATSEHPRRATSGVDSTRVAMILAILQEHAGLRLGQHDVFVSSVGGAKLTEPSNDLAIALALVSAFTHRALGRQVVAMGELGLAGELRKVRSLPIRLAEAGRLGFRSAVVPAQSPATAGQSRVQEGVRTIDIYRIADALALLELTQSGPQPTRPDRADAASRKAR